MDRQRLLEEANAKLEQHLQQRSKSNPGSFREQDDRQKEREVCHLCNGMFTVIC